MQEIFESSTGLIDKSGWEAAIDKLKGETAPATEFQVREAITRAVEERVPQERCALMLSGGVDSSLIALLLKANHADVICYTVGVEGSDDLVAAREVAKFLDLKHKEKILSDEEMHSLLKKTKSLFRDDLFPNNPNPAVLLGVAAVEIAVLNLAKEDGIKIFFGGLGAEEIFAGYNRHGKAEDLNEECWRGLRDVMYERDLRRDAKVAASANVRFAAPFLDKDLIRAAMGIPGDQKINAEHKKLILRKIAKELGLPEHIAFRKKKAAQYGSAFMKSIERVSKAHGFRYTRDYFESL